MDWIDRIGRRVKLRDLHILLAVTQAGTMGRAATAMSVSQPVISKAISELEAALGARLFDRTAQGIVPTAYGKAIIQCSRAVFDELQQGVKAIEYLDDPTRGQLHIGCTEFGAMGMVPLVIEELVRRHPRLQFHVLTADPAALAILPRVASRLAKHLPIKPVNVDFPGIGRSIGVLTLKGRTLSPVAQQLIGAARLAVAGVLKRTR